MLDEEILVVLHVLSTSERYPMLDEEILVVLHVLSTSERYPMHAKQLSHNFTSAFLTRYEICTFLICVHLLILCYKVVCGTYFVNLPY